MPDITLTYRLTLDLWRQFYTAHYAADRTLKIRYLWGIVCIVIGSSGLGGLFESQVVAVLLLLTGFYGVLSRPLFVNKSVGKASRHPFVDQIVTVTLSAEELMVRSESSGYRQPWSNFVGYRRVGPGVILYMERQSFFFVPAAALDAESEAALVQILKAAGVTGR